MGKLLVTVFSVALAVGVFTALWVSVNLVFDQTTKNWSRFSALAGGLVGFVVFSVLHGNQLLTHAPGMEATRDALTWGNDRDPSDFLANIAALMWWAIPGAGVGAGVGYALSKATEAKQRLIIGVGAGLVVGLIVGFTLKTAYMPRLQTGPLIGWPVGFGLVGAAYATIRNKALAPTAAVFVAIGWICGSFGAANLGGGPLIETLISAVVPALLVGFAIGSTRHPDANARTVIDQKSRAWIFMTPALLFISATLILPTIITAVLSFRDDNSEGFVGADNYSGVVRVNGGWNTDNFDLDDWSNFFTSRLLWIGLPLLIIGLIVAMVEGKQTGRARSWSPQSGFISLAGGVLLTFGLFSVLRGTIFNNLWWVVTVTVFATGMGLAVAAWSDGAKGEKIAKSLIFMPMAISFVGASIIWRFMYRSQDQSKPQTGVLNSIWAWLGSKTAGAAPTSGDVADYDPERFSNLGVGIFDFEIFNFPAKWLFVAIFVAMAAFFLYKAVSSAPKHGLAGIVGWGLAFLIPAYLAYRTGSEGIGGYQIITDDAGVATGTVIPKPITFLETGPFNNFWLMVVLLWIETGFAMVILSAAIKAVPAEYIEAAKIDGADDTQVFWRITIPQIAPTIGVVVTTIVVRVTKVYDIVKVMTGGNFDTDVLANRMINQSFQFSRTGTGAALAIILFLSVLPVMIMNIRRMQKEAAV